MTCCAVENYDKMLQLSWHKLKQMDPKIRDEYTIVFMCIKKPKLNTMILNPSGQKLS